MTNKLLNIILVTFFAALIALPGIFFNRTETVSKLENKTLAKMPVIKIDGKYNKNFFPQFGTYVDDNIGFKDKIVLTDIKLSHKLFHKIKQFYFIEGNDGHLFYMPPHVITSYQGKTIPVLSEARKEHLAKNIINMRNYFSDKGIPLIVAAFPNKEFVYPEYMPDSIIQSGEPFFDSLVKYMQKNTDVDAVSLQDILISSKKDMYVYNKCIDTTHWNFDGALIGYNVLMKKIQKYLPSVKILDKQKDLIRNDHVNQSCLGETSMIIRDNYTSYSLVSRNISLSWTPPENLNINPESLFRHYTNKDRTLPKLLVIGDSYIYAFILPYMAESFSDTYLISFNNVNTVKGLVKTIDSLVETVKPDIVLFAATERAINYSIVEHCGQFSNLLFKYDAVGKLSEKTWFNLEQPTVDNRTISIGNSSTVLFSGWAVDVKSNSPTGGVYVKIGNDYYRTQTFERPDVEKLNPGYTNAGFKLNIPRDLLLDVDTVSLIFTTNDGNSIYLPEEYKIELKNKMR